MKGTLAQLIGIKRLCGAGYTACWKGLGRKEPGVPGTEGRPKRLELVGEGDRAQVQGQVRELRIFKKIYLIDFRE